MLPIRAITLNDTIWPIAPTIARAEQAPQARLEPPTHPDHKDTLSA